MCKFKKLIIKPKEQIYRNLEYIPEIIALFKKYKTYLIDDYAQPFGTEDIIKYICNINPYFWIITDKLDNFAGFAYLDNWTGNAKHSHCAEVTTCFKKDYWGAFTKICSKKFIKYCFKKYKLKKLKACIFPENKRVIRILKLSGFKKEATLKSETLRNGKLQDIEIYSIIKE